MPAGGCLYNVLFVQRFVCTVLHLYRVSSVRDSFYDRGSLCVLTFFRELRGEILSAYAS